jgi:hypothetical protein
MLVGACRGESWPQTVPAHHPSSIGTGRAVIASCQAQSATRAGDVVCATSSIIAHGDWRKAEADGGCRTLAAEAMGAAWTDEGPLSLAVGCWLSAVQLHTPSKQRLPGLPSRAICLPVGELTTSHNSACQWSASCSATALRRCLFDAQPDPGVGLM